MPNDINDLLINITLDSAPIDGAFLLCKVMFTIMGRILVPVPVPVLKSYPHQFPFPLQFQFGLAVNTLNDIGRD